MVICRVSYGINYCLRSLVLIDTIDCNMQPPYKENPECHYQKSIALDADDRAAIRLHKIFSVLPVAIVSATLLVFMVRLMIKNPTGSLVDFILALSFFTVFTLSVSQLFRKEQHKEVFESVLNDTIGFIFVSKAWFKDGYDSFYFASPFRSYFKLKTRKRYRVHIVQGGRMIVKLEELVS